MTIFLRYAVNMVAEVQITVDEKNRNGLISKKAILHVQDTVFVHLFAVVLHDYNVKLPETS